MLRVALGLSWAVLVVAGLAMLALAAWLMRLAPHHPVNRSFALFLAVRGVSNAGAPLFWTLDGEGTTYFPVAALADHMLVLAVVYFAVVYRRHEHGVRYPGWLPGTLVAAAVAVLAAAILDPHSSLVYTGTWPLDDAVIQPGWLAQVLIAPYLLTLAVIAALLLRDAARTQNARVRSSSVLLSFGFVAYPLNATLTLLTSIHTYAGPPPEPSGAGWTWFYAGLAVPLAVAISSIARVLVHGSRPGGVQPRMARAYALGAVAVIATAVLPMFGAALLGWSDVTAIKASRVSGAFAILAMPLFGTWALVRHQLFGVDAKVKFAVRQSTIAAVFVAVFFAASEGATAFFGERFDSTYVGIGVTALLVFALAPLKRLADRFADVAMPDVRVETDLPLDDRTAVYRDQVRFAWSDRVLSADERRMLNQLRQRLRIPAEDAARIEDEVLGA